jgi:hypothetical protein
MGQPPSSLEVLVMDPLSMAVAQIIIAASASIGQQGAKAAGAVLQRLVSVVRSRFAGAPAGAKDGPPPGLTDGETDVHVIASRLDVLIRNDKEFRQELVDLLEELGGDPATARFMTEVTGGTVNKLVNIGNVEGNVSF